MPKGDYSQKNPDKHRESARLGGINAHRLGRAHEWTSEEASQAGMRGGAATAAKGKAHMAEIGRVGGKRAKCRHVISKMVYVDGAQMAQCVRCGKIVGEWTETERPTTAKE